MLKRFFANIKIILAYIVLGIVIIGVCIASALYALRIEAELEPLTKQTLAAYNHTVTIDTPFTMEEDAGFNVEPEIRYYVRSHKAYYGTNNELSLHIYSVTYKSELFEDTWTPNTNDMAMVSINTLRKNILLRDLQSESKNIKIDGLDAVQVTSVYQKGNEHLVQKVVHIPTHTSTWSFKATYKDNKKLSETVNRLLQSITLKEDL